MDDRRRACAVLTVGQPVVAIAALQELRGLLDAVGARDSDPTGASMFSQDQHTAQCGIPPSLTKESPNLYVGYFANPFGEQWIFTFDRTTRKAQLRSGDVDWATVHVVRDSRVDGLILGREEAAWLQVCWKAATA